MVGLGRFEGIPAATAEYGISVLTDAGEEEGKRDFFNLNASIMSISLR